MTRPLPEALVARRRQDFLEWHTKPALYHREGLLARADATLRQALASDPGQPEAHKHLRAVSTALQTRRTPVAAPELGRPGLVARLLFLRR